MSEGAQVIEFEHDDALKAAAVAAPGPSLLRQFIAGGAGGVCLVFTGHPLDTVKVKIQTMTVVKGQAPMYSGTMDCINQTIKSDGFKGLYKGMAAPILGVTPMYALCFFGFGVGQKIFCKEDSFTNLNQENLGRIALAGATSGLFTTPILAPGERLKCVMQTAPKGMYDGPIDCLKKLYGAGGMKSMMRGFTATAGRDSIASAFYFSSYEVLKQALTPAGESGPGIGGTLLAGGSAGIFNWAIALPIDTLKSKLQVAPDGKYPHGIRSVFREVMQNEGPRALYRGFVPVMLRAFPANAACFLGYESALKFLDYVNCP
ncbi:hypothetical protein SARC_11064 [Sphaeroforma arctica JP610]|uniref:Mitochondrial carnitine/acylcarnitine carrier protein n=1 Tax=Sphaeroforma arctica JP610 TaxID=667725 RepID=A0A0L0FIY7_9EUKA|nr:hypothetical protein SARC_11064 [Sphaeroforma arctica JP610]KNC76436.1 hypothetical protein SARC_11064 [Sphaeroforma arctica JP610]|eukprot:XP_014150338.1 hypothetical protein SARC_11064 [Sphaeroforma arctica JP610]